MKAIHYFKLFLVLYSISSLTSCQKESPVKVGGLPADAMAILSKIAPPQDSSFNKYVLSLAF